MSKVVRSIDEIELDIRTHRRDSSPHILADYENELAEYYIYYGEVEKAVAVYLKMIRHHWRYEDIATKAQLRLAELYCDIHLGIAFIIARGLFTSIKKSDKERLRSIFERCAPLWYRPIADFRLWLISL